ncbi:hypothetical protein F5Y15DRAFT_287109 [Xylariaceae sp. FL0016]|nr:hypothetical protein F5Y15DRAFT_287109 [Xylariaceae sp. FL0016]
MYSSPSESIQQRNAATLLLADASQSLVKNSQHQSWRNDIHILYPCLGEVYAGLFRTTAEMMLCPSVGAETWKSEHVSSHEAFPGKVSCTAQPRWRCQRDVKGRGKCTETRTPFQPLPGPFTRLRCATCPRNPHPHCHLQKSINPEPTSLTTALLQRFQKTGLENVCQYSDPITYQGVHVFCSGILPNKSLNFIHLHLNWMPSFFHLTEPWPSLYQTCSRHTGSVTTCEEKSRELYNRVQQFV